MISRRLLSALVAVAAVLLVSIAVLAPLAMLLEALGDGEGSRLIRGTAVAALVALAVDLICLLLALGLAAAEPPRGRSDADDLGAADFDEGEGPAS